MDAVSTHRRPGADAMLKAAEHIEPERREPYLRGTLTIAAVVPVALLWSLIFGALFLDKGEADGSASDLRIYEP